MEHAVKAGTRAEADLLTLTMGMSHGAITECILERAYTSGYKAALIDAPQGTVTAWPRFARIVPAAADGLSRRGLTDGDTAGVFVQDAASFAIAVNAIRAAGAIAAPIPPDTSMAEVAAQLNACGARVLITAAPLAELAAEAADRSRVRQVFAFGDAAGTTPFRSLLGVARHGAAQQELRDRGPADKRGRAGGNGHHDRNDSIGPWPGPAGPRQDIALSQRDVVVAGPPCGKGQAYTALLDLTLLTGATLVAAPVPLIAAAMRAYKGTAAIVPRGTEVPGIPADRVFAVA